jgi:protein-disulfide isomerase
MIRSVPRRTILASLAGLPALALLASCSDSGGGQVPAAEAAPATPAPAAPTPATPAAAAPAPSGKVDMAKLLEEGALPDKTIGNADAPVTIVEYASMTCSHCATFHVETLPAIKEKYIDTGKARLVFREFPFDPRAEAGFMLARCADDKYFAMVDVLFKQQRTWAAADNAREALLQIARLLAGIVRGLPDRSGASRQCARRAPARRQRFRHRRHADLLHQRQQIFGGFEG